MTENNETAREVWEVPALLRATQCINNLGYLSEETTLELESVSTGRDNNGKPLQCRSLSPHIGFRMYSIPFVRAQDHIAPA